MKHSALGATALLVAVTAASVAIGTTRADAAAHAGSTPLDVEIAVDSTGSMAPLIEQAKKDAQAIVDAVQAVDPEARFAVVAFRDAKYPAPEYEVLQRFTADTDAVKTAIGRLKSVGTTDPANVPSEGYNLLFDKSVSDRSLGWRPASRKVVVVLGDAEPHGAGTVGIRGCRDTAPDPRGLNTVDVLARMRAAGRTLLMVRQQGVDATLECYGSIAAQAAPGGAARNAGSADLAGPIRVLLQGTVVPLEASAGFPLALPGTTRALTFKIQNTTSSAVTLDSLTVRLPAGTRFVSSQGPFGPPSTKGRTIGWTPAKALAPRASSALVTRVLVGPRGRPAFKAAIGITLADGTRAAASTVARVRVGRTLGLKIVSAGGSRPAAGTVSLTYPASARSLVGATATAGTIGFGAKTTQVAVKLTTARVTAAAANTAVTAEGVVTSSQNPSCAAGTRVTVRLVDRDVRKPRTAPDLIRVAGGSCGTVATGDVITR